MAGYGLTERVSFVYLARRLLVACGRQSRAESVDEWQLATRVVYDDSCYVKVFNKKFKVKRT